MSLLGADSRRDMEIRRYPLLVYALVPLAALVLQAWLPRVVGRYDWFDLPLVVTVYFALGRRNPVAGHHSWARRWACLRMRFRITPSASTASPRLWSVFWLPRWAFASTSRTTIIRLLLNFVLSLLSSGDLSFCSRFLLGLAVEWSWLTELFGRLATR